MPVSQLRDAAQLSQSKPFQLGTTDEPCVILFGLGEIDKDKSWRTIKIVPNDNDLKVLQAFDNANDSLQDIVKEHDGIKYVCVKVNDSRTKSFNDLKEKVQLAEVTTQSSIVKVVIRANAWSMNEQHGIYFQAALIQAVEDSIDVDDLC
jgi:hypothetical protein